MRGTVLFRNVNTLRRRTVRTLIIYVEMPRLSGTVLILFLRSAVRRQQCLKIFFGPRYSTSASSLSAVPLTLDYFQTLFPLIKYLLKQQISFCRAVFCCSEELVFGVSSLFVPNNMDLYEYQSKIQLLGLSS